jgi:hypothetical protein
MDWSETLAHGRIIEEKGKDSVWTVHQFGADGGTGAGSEDTSYSSMKVPMSALEY